MTSEHTTKGGRYGLAVSHTCAEGLPASNTCIRP
jgi:hypothetical protein